MKMINVLMLMLAMSLQSPAIFAATADVDSEKEYDSDDFDSDDFDSDSDDDLSLAAMHRRLRANVVASAQASTDVVTTEAGASSVGDSEVLGTLDPDAGIAQSGLDFSDPGVIEALEREWQRYLQDHESHEVAAGWGGAEGAAHDKALVAPAPVPVVQKRYFSVDELSTLSGFANALFASRAEANFIQGNLLPGNENEYVSKRLTNPLFKKMFNKKNINPASLVDEFLRYRVTVWEERCNNDTWLTGEKTNFFTYAENDTSGIDDCFLKTKDKGLTSERSDAYVEKKIIRRSGEPDKNVLFMGDIHGSVHALLRNLLAMRQLGFLHEDFRLAEHVHIVFLGDFVDRGLHGLESLYLVLRLKNANWHQVHIVRGNHESGWLTADYGFQQEVSGKYINQEEVVDIWTCYAQFCSSLPSAIFLGVSDGIDDTGVDRIKFMQACHGGLAPTHDPRDLFLADDSVLYQKISYVDAGKGYEWHDVCCSPDAERLRGADLATASLESVSWKGSERSRAERRPTIFQFHRDDITKMLHKKELFMLMRGHQDLDTPCKVLHDGLADPISWRNHPAFEGITPARFFTNGIGLLNAPNCMTLSTATEARGLDHEGFLVIRFGRSLALSTLWVYEVNLGQQVPDGRYVHYGDVKTSGWFVATDGSGSMQRLFNWLPTPPQKGLSLGLVAKKPYAPTSASLAFDFRKARVQDAIRLQSQEEIDAISWGGAGVGAGSSGRVAAE